MAVSNVNEERTNDEVTMMFSTLDGWRPMLNVMLYKKKKKTVP
jgi:hypothetical protein